MRQNEVESVIDSPAQGPSEVGRDVHEGVERAAGRHAGHAGQAGDPLQDVGPPRRRTAPASRRPSPAGPVIASSAAHWLTEQGLLVSWLWRSPMNLATAGGAIAQPIRQPVIA